MLDLRPEKMFPVKAVFEVQEVHHRWLDPVQ